MIVTSAYHSRRALWTFQRVFSDSGVKLGLDPVPTGQQTPGPWDLVASFPGLAIGPG